MSDPLIEADYLGSILIIKTAVRDAVEAERGTLPALTIRRKGPPNGERVRVLARRGLL